MGWIHAAPFRRLVMRANTESTMAVIAAFLVLFTAMLDPRVSSALAVVALLVFAVMRARIIRR